MGRKGQLAGPPCPRARRAPWAPPRSLTTGQSFGHDLPETLLVRQDALGALKGSLSRHFSMAAVRLKPDRSILAYLERMCALATHGEGRRTTKARFLDGVATTWAIRGDLLAG